MIVCERVKGVRVHHFFMFSHVYYFPSLDVHYMFTMFKVFNMFKRVRVSEWKERARKPHHRDGSGQVWLSRRGQRG